jgi:hypothetical protein
MLTYLPCAYCYCACLRKNVNKDFFICPVVASSPPATEETGAMLREIESRQLKKKNFVTKILLLLFRSSLRFSTSGHVVIAMLANYKLLLEIRVT